MNASSSAAAQADFMEKEKAVTEHQQHVESLESIIKMLSSRQVKVKIQGRRNEITIIELMKLKPTHTVFQGIGRAFLKRSVNDLIEQNQGEKEKNEAEYQRLVNEKQRSADTLVRAERDLKKAVEDLRTGYQMLIATQGGAVNSKA